MEAHIVHWWSDIGGDGPIRIFDHLDFGNCYFNTTPNDTNLEEKIPWLQSYYPTPNDTNLEPK